MARKPPKHTRKPDRRRQDRAAKALGRGKSLRGAARLAGETSKRALEGVTYAEWLKNDPWFAARVEKYRTESMTGEEWEDINAAVARGKIPERVIVDGQGRIVQRIFSNDNALNRLGRARGKLKDGLGEPPATGAGLGALFTADPKKLATLAEAAAAVLRSAPTGE
jgi:hypothetical protein